MMKRKHFLGSLASISLLQMSTISAFANFGFKTKKIGACDWSLGQNSKPEAFDIAKAIGLSGVQVNLGNEANNLHLRQKNMQEIYLAKSKETGVKITSLAIGELNNIPYKSDNRTDQWVADCIEVAKNLDVNVVLLAFFVKNDLRNDQKGIETVIAKLKEVAPTAEKMGITLGIESYLTAEEHLYIMEKVGSKAIKVYYDFRNAQDAGNDIYKEIKLLGNENICELHLKENGKFLGNGDIDWQKVANSIDDLGFSKKKWKQIEWSLPANFDYIEGHKKNLNYLKNIS
jgi:L-ribulose-5-phosphate 3-epimerase